MNADNNKPTPTMDLISKYLAGEANAEEAMLLDDWLADPDNAREFKRIAALWNQLPGATIPQTPSPQEAWTELEPLLPADRRPVIVRLLFNRYMAAAVTGLLICLSFIWLSRDRDQRPDQSNVLTYYTKAATSHVKPDTMPDGTTITINRNSSVVYTTHFNQSDRSVILKGECYFNVAPDQSNPFIISMGQLNIKVVGTSFNVRENTPPGNIEVQVQSGVVKMYTSQQEIMVHKGQTGIYNLQNRNLHVRDTLDINSLSYATKTFSFNDIAFTDACRYLENAFNVKIAIDTQKFAGCRISAQFDNKPLDYILNVIDATLNTTHQQQGNTIQIKGKGCQ